MAKRVFDRAFELGASQQRSASQAAGRASSGRAVPDTRLLCQPSRFLNSSRPTPPAHAGSEQKLNRFWRGIGTTDRPISAAAQKATAKGSTMTLQTILDPERAASSSHKSSDRRTSL